MSGSLDAKWYDANNVDEIDYDDWNYETVTIYAIGKYGRIPTEECPWHVGGTSYNATEVVDMILDNFNRNGENHNGERYVSLIMKVQNYLHNEQSGKLTADDVINLATYGTTNAQGHCILFKVTCLKVHVCVG